MLGQCADSTMCRQQAALLLQGVLDDKASYSAGSAPAAEPLSSPAPAAPSMPSSFPDAEAPLRAPYSSDEELNDWPILREGEGGKLVNLPALNLLTCCPHAFYTSIRSTGASDTEGVARDADAGRRIVDQEGVCVIGAPPASSAEPARVLLRGG